MKYLIINFLLATISLVAIGQNNDSVVISKIYKNALNSKEAYLNLQEIMIKAAPRELGSHNSLVAVDLFHQMLTKQNCGEVKLQPYNVDTWQHIGSYAKLELGSGKSIQLHVKALGPSVSTSKKGLTTEVIEVSGIKELKSLKKEDVEGKIVFFNNLMDNLFVVPVDAYVLAVHPRLFGANEAARKGAVGAIMRSISTLNDDYVHTGCLRYNEIDKKIPAVAISTKEADLLSSIIGSNSNAKLNLKVFTRIEENHKTYNIIAERKGSTHPEEVIAIGAHIDTWYNTPGAHDDGAGCVQMIDVLRIFEELNIDNKRTIRVILFMDEEMFTSGAKAYVAQHNNPNEKFIAAIESDLGAFSPEGFLIDGSDSEISKIQDFSGILKSYGLYNILKGFGGGDMHQLKQKFGFPSIALKVNSQRYFEIIHTEKDVFETVNRRELQMGTAAISSLVYLIDKYSL